jgi:predicted lipoprotein with Yx(FWY)xxD motif
MRADARLLQRLLGLLVVPLVCLTAGCGSASPVLVKTSQFKHLGSILVDKDGQALYHMKSETNGAIKCTGPCTKLWPPLTVGGGAKVTAGPGVSASKLGTIKRPDGKTQVTYNGLPLYRYTRDVKVGVASSQGLDDFWYAVTPAGTVTKLDTARVGECPPGVAIPQGAVDDDDDDNTVAAPSDGDGCY